MSRSSPLAIFLVRAWVEENGQLRARVSRSYDSGLGPPVERLTADPTQLAAYLNEWLGAVLRRDDDRLVADDPAE